MQMNVLRFFAAALLFLCAPFPATGPALAAARFNALQRDFISSSPFTNIPHAEIYTSGYIPRRSEGPELVKNLSVSERAAPVPKSTSGVWNLTLLYPVYSYLPYPEAAAYEVELLSEYPKSDSVQRIFSKITTLCNVYDPSPRIGTYYWRVRALDASGEAISEWSLPTMQRTSPADLWEVGLYGDSITHGGGHVLYSPSDPAYSYGTYLDFPAVNLAKSGDSMAMLVARFDRDVLPFHVRTLLVMGGINSIRTGKSAASVIQGLEALRQACMDHHIRPILLTLPPINPDALRRIYHEATPSDWRVTLDAVNAYIRSVPHIDTAAPFGEGALAEDMAFDGLHGDPEMKRIIAMVINAHRQELGL